ncbi:hypothetical protein AKJ41_01125 [candidate division MSBL1 archaeon SCGC-AAA259O05]|uniref:Uncharacterized protein n=1 Tax=candidate division MSBL1 archaeon SCGC-AAA259O05 TaxID=1698271 RepID=A0A133V556_9EURY|nr:hypothetical protein AKJ41_01125 [candidate division MSBL1 archaeon SCGC-AAA259O05]
MRYGSNWNDLDHDEEEKIWKTLITQVDTTYYRKNLHSIVAEWINENYYLDLEVEMYDPDEDALKLDTVQARVRTTQHGGYVYLDIPRQREVVIKKSYTGTPDLGRAIDTAINEFAENRDLFTRGVLDEVDIDGEVDPERLRGIEEYIYERVAGDFGRRYLSMLEEQIPGLTKIKRG